MATDMMLTKALQTLVAVEELLENEPSLEGLDGIPSQEYLLKQKVGAVLSEARKRDLIPDRELVEDFDE